MNLFLHNIGEIDGSAPISPSDSLVADAGERYDYVLANPPFGRKSALSFTNEEGEQETDDLTYNRQDFWATTSNKQLNFVQHIRTMLKTTGRAAVVVPDNVLFEGGAGETIRRKLLDTTDLHTILRLPTGVFYAQGVKANVIFFDNREASPDPWTKRVWYYDYRTNIHHTLKKKPMRFENLADFIKCYNPQNRHERTATWDEKAAPEGRWRGYSYEEIIARDKTSLDIFWLKDKSLTDLDDLPEPEDLANEIIDLEAGLESFRKVLEGHLLAQGQELDRPRRSARARGPGQRDHREPRSRPGELPQGVGRARAATDVGATTHPASDITFRCSFVVGCSGNRLRQKRRGEPASGDRRSPDAAVRIAVCERLRGQTFQVIM